jgi:hypothetical protein
MKHVTVSDIMDARPCSDYPRSRVDKLWAGRESLTPREIAALEIQVQDRLWALIKCCLDGRQRRLFACECAERALTLIDNPDPRSVEAIRVARAYAVGEATDQQLAAARAEAWDAAWDAASSAARAEAWDAASSAAWDAASAEAWDAASSAAWAAASAEAWDAQLEMAVNRAEGVE